MTTRPIRLLLIAAALAVVAAACSTGDSTTTTQAASPTTTANNDQAAAARAVAQLQEGLTELGYYTGPIDGIYGPATTEGVSNLQADLGVTVDGRYGPETHTALVNALGTVESEAVKTLQTELADLGYYQGDIDGLYGPETTDAIKKAQADCGITQDGIYGPETHACLIDLGGDA